MTEQQTQIDVQQVIQNLANQIASMTTDMAVKDAMISQLQTQLAEMASPPVEDDE